MYPRWFSWAPLYSNGIQVSKMVPDGALKLRWFQWAALRGFKNQEGIQGIKVGFNPRYCPTLIFRFPRKAAIMVPK